MDKLTSADEQVKDMDNRLKEISDNVNNPHETRIVPVKDGNGDELMALTSNIEGKRVYHEIGSLEVPRLLKSMPNFTPRDDDIWLCAYPKSGTHWTNEVVGIMLSGELKSLTEFKRFGMIDSLSSMEPYNDIPPPRLLNTHFLPQYLSKPILETGKIIQIMRNPKSVAVSWYYHTRHMTYYNYQGKFDGFLKYFLDEDHKVLGNSVMGSWFGYVKEWWTYSQRHSNVLVVFYEDLKKTPTSTFKQIGGFLGLKRSDDFYEKLVDLTSFQKMEKGEGKAPKAITGMKMAFTPGQSMFRKGQIESWKNDFTVAQSEMFDAYTAESLKDHPELLSKLQYK